MLLWGLIVADMDRLQVLPFTIKCVVSKMYCKLNNICGSHLVPFFQDGQKRPTRRDGFF